MRVDHEIVDQEVPKVMKEIKEGKEF